MYSKDIEEVIDAALLVGVMTDNVRNALRSKAEAEGEDADEVIMVAEMRLKKSMQDTPQSDSEYDVILRNDEVKEVTDNQYEELEQFRKDGYFVYEISNDYIGIVASITHDYNSRAKEWGYPEMIWSELFPDPDLNVLYVKDVQLEFSEYMQHVGNNCNIEEFGYRNGYMDAATSIINHICYPFKYIRKNDKPVFDIATNNVTLPQLEPKTQLTVPKSAIPNVRKLIEGYNKKAAK